MEAPDGGYDENPLWLVQGPCSGTAGGGGGAAGCCGPYSFDQPGALRMFDCGFEPSK